MKLTPEQLQAIAKCREAAARCATFAVKADSLGLPVLASFLREASHLLTAGVDYQQRAFRENALQQPERKVIDANTPEQRFQSNVYGLGGESPPNEERQADTIADTMKRRGLLKKPIVCNVCGVEFTMMEGLEGHTCQ